MTDYEESYEQQLEGVGHPPTTVYRVSTHHAFQEHNGSSSSRSPSLGSPSADSTESSHPAVAEVRDTQQAVRHWTYEEQFRQVRVCMARKGVAVNDTKYGMSLQLYNMSSEPGRKEFLDKLFDFMQKKGESSKRLSADCFVFLSQPDN